MGDGNTRRVDFRWRALVRLRKLHRDKGRLKGRGPHRPSSTGPSYIAEFNAIWLQVIWVRFVVSIGNLNVLAVFLHPSPWAMFFSSHAHLIHFFAQILHTYGYLALFLALLIEYLVFLVPGEPFLLAAAAYSVTGRLSLPLVILAAAAGAAVGLNNAYWIGRAGGDRFLTGHASRFRVKPANLDRLHRFFERHGAMAVFLLRFVTVLRILVGYLAGVERMDFRVFTIFNVLGAIAWATVIGLLGYAFADSLRVLSRFLTDTGLAVAVILVLAAIVYWTRRQRAGTKLPDKRDAAAMNR